MTAANETLIHGERECYNYILKITGAIDGQSAFVGELPPMHEAFMFALNGGPDPSYADGTHTSSWCSWILAGELLGNYKEREDALRLWGALLEGMPAGLNHSRNAADFTYTQTLRLDAQPNLTVEYLRLPNGGDKVYRVWQLSAIFQAVINNP